MYRLAKYETISIILSVQFKISESCLVSEVNLDCPPTIIGGTIELPQHNGGIWDRSLISMWTRIMDQ